MKFKELIQAWDDANRPTTTQSVIDFLKANNYSADEITAAFKKANYNIHISTPKIENPDVAKEKTTSLSHSEPKVEPSDHVPRDKLVNDSDITVPIGTKIDFQDKTYEWKGAAWVSGGKLAKKELSNEITKAAKEKIKKQNESVKSTIPGLDVGTVIVGPDNKIYTWKGAAWVTGSTLAKKEIAAELTKSVLAQSNIKQEDPHVPETHDANTNTNQESTSAKVQHLYSVLNQYGPAAISLLQSTDPLANVALAIILSPHRKELLDVLKQG